MASPLPRRPGRLLFALLLTGSVGTTTPFSSAPAFGQTAPANGRASPEAHQKFSGAVALQNRGEYELAADAWSEFLEAHAKDPLVSRARHYRGVCRSKLQQFAGAQADFEKVLKDAPKINLIESTYVNLGLVLFNRAQLGGDDATPMFDQAVGTFQKQLENFPDGEYAPMARYYQGEALYAQNKLPEAITAYESFVEKHAKHALRPDALYGLGVAQAESGDVAAAEGTFQVFLGEAGDNPLATEVTMRLGDALFAQGKHAAAQPHFATASAATDFEHADYALLREAACRFETGDFRRAAELYAALVERFPESPHTGVAALNAGKALLRDQRHDDAARWLRQAVQSGGGGAFEASHWLARAELAADHPAEALQVATAALAGSPPTNWQVPLALDRADALYAMPKRRAEAVAAYEQIAATRPDDPQAPQALYLAADTALAVREYRQALALAERFMKTYTDHESLVRIRHIAAEAQLQLKQYEAAAAAFQALLNDQAEDPSRDAWRNRLALALSLGGRHAETIALLTLEIEGIKNEAARAESELLLGAAHLKQQEFERAARLLQTAADRAAKAGAATLVDRALLQLSRAQYGAGDFAAAIAAAKRLLAEFPHSRLAPETELRLAEYHAAAGDDAAAIAAFESVLTGDPDSRFYPHALVGIANARARKGDFPKVIEHLDALLSRYPEHPLAVDALLSRAVARQKTDDFDGGLADIAAFLEARPDGPHTPDALYVRGQCQAGKKAHEEAIQTLEAILASHPQYAGNDRVLYELAWSQHDRGGVDAAVATFARLAKEHPESPLAAECHYRVGEAQYVAEDYAGAVQSYTSARDRGAGELAEKAQHKLGWSHYQQGDYVAAEKAFAAQLDAVPAGKLAGDAHVMRGEALFKQDKFADALDALTKSLHDKPSDDAFRAIALLHAGQSAGRLGKWEEGLALLERCADEHPECPYRDEVDFERARAMQELNRSDDALPLFREVAARNETVVGARARFRIGEIQMAKKEYAEAVRTLFQVAYGYGYPDAPDEFHPFQCDAMFDAARCLEQLGKKASALNVYRELLERFPNSEKCEHAKIRLDELTKS